MKTVAIFFGGKSNEHEISVITGMLAVNLLRETYRVIPVYITTEGELYASEDMCCVDDFNGFDPKRFPRVAIEGRRLSNYAKRKKTVAEIDCALNCCHGGAGENGTLSAVLEWNGIPSASPSLAVSSVFMNKELGKIAARGLGIPVADSFTVRESEWTESEEKALSCAESFGYPVIVKPSRLGSSIGIKVAKNAEEFSAALDLAFRLDNSVLVERYFPDKRDINCAAYRAGGKTLVSSCEEVFSDEEILTFSEKYEGAGARNSKLPAQLPEALAAEIGGYVKLLYESFDVCGVVRADFLVSGDKVYFNELNTVPGSLACYLFGETLSDSRGFLASLVEEAAPEKSKDIVQSGILSDGVFSGGKSCKRRRNFV